MKKYLSITLAIILCLLCCSCSNNVDEPINSTTEIITEETTKFIESLHFELNEIVANSKPEDLYIQIGDVYFSPTEALKTSEFIERADKSIMKLTYKICEDDIKDIFVDYTPEYLVPGEENINIFFYCDGQLVFDIEVMNFSDTATAIKDCFVFTMNEKYENFSKQAVNTKGISWFFKGIPFGGDEYTLSSTKDLFDQFNLKYEESTNSDILKLSAKLNKIEIKFEQQNGIIYFYPYYIAEIDQSTGKVTTFYYRITGYNKGTYTPTETKTSTSSTTSTQKSNKPNSTKNNNTTDSLYIKGSGETPAETTTVKYIDSITGYDGRVYYKVFDEENNRYYYTDNSGKKYAESYVLEQIRPTTAEIKANPISKVTLYGVTWYKYKTGSGSFRYLTSDGRDCTGIEVNVQTYGKESVTIDGVTFYKTRINGQYEYVDSQGNCLEYDNSYCHQCGSPDCTPSLNSYYCVICKKTIAGSECHPTTHFYESH